MRPWRRSTISRRNSDDFLLDASLNVGDLPDVEHPLVSRRRIHSYSGASGGTPQRNTNSDDFMGMSTS